MILSDVSVKRPVFAAVISLLLVCFGVISFGSLSVRELPDIESPIVGVKTRYPGASAAIVETRVTQLVESAVAGVQGIKVIDSESSYGESKINIEFELGRDIDAAANDVRDRVSRILNNLPEEVEPPEVSKNDSEADAVIWLNLSSDTLDVMQLTDYAERHIVDRLSVVDGASSIIVAGRQNYALRIHLDRQAMAAREITVIDIENAIRQENVELPAGKIESIHRDTIVRVNREYSDPDDFKKLVISEGRSGDLIYLGDVARIELGREKEQRFFRMNGRSAIGMGIVKQSKGNTLTLAEAALAEVEKIQATLPKSMKLLVSYNEAVFIESAISEVYTTFAITMALVVAVLYLFLGNIRTVMVPTLTVPVCLVSTFFILSLTGVSINLITLLALVMAIGLVVDDAIVVLENIYRRVENGEPGIVAAYRGARQVSFAVLATTLVLIGVFVPIMFLSGSVGQIFGELAITICAAVALSSLIALTLSPMMCSKLVRRRNKKPGFAKMLDRQFRKLEAGYARLLEVCLANKTLVVLCFLTCFGLIAALQPKLPNELAPTEDKGFFFMIIRAPEGASYEYVEKQALLAEKQLLQHVGEGGELDRFLIRASATGGFGFSVMVPWDERERSSTEIVNEIRPKLMKEVPGMMVLALEPAGISTGGNNGSEFELVIGGNTYEDLGRYKQVLLEELSNYPGLQDLDIDYKDNQPQFGVQINKDRAADIGVPIQVIGRTLETMMGGRKVTTYLWDGEEYDVILQAEKEDRQQPLDMENIYVSSIGNERAMVPLSNLVSVEEKGGASKLHRYNRVRALTISGTPAPGYALGDVIEHVEGMVRETLPDVSNIDYKGATLEYKEAGSDIYFVFAMALVVVFLVLAAQFESFIHPFIILLTVPLAILGGLLGLYLADSTINIYSQLGMIILIGLAAKNGILIVEFANQKRDQGLEVGEALRHAARERLRPIMMTGLSTAIGAVPLMMAVGAGSASRATIGVVIFSGVSIATVFTLFVIPVFYEMLAKYTKSPNHVALQLEDFEEKEKAGIPAE